MGNAELTSEPSVLGDQRLRSRSLSAFRSNLIDSMHVKRPAVTALHQHRPEADEVARGRDVLGSALIFRTRPIEPRIYLGEQVKSTFPPLRQTYWRRSR